MDNKEFALYADMKERTHGEIYIGVVGPVRTGKSTFIKRFMDLCVIPQIENEYMKNRALDELPQSGGGTTIMTTEPKFVPSEAAVICPVTDMNIKIRLIDCVGFIVEGASGIYENDRERLVKTPWLKEEIPFTKAAEIGTVKVIEEHSTIGIVVFTDGSFSQLPRSSYIDAEEKTISKLKALNKPFVVLLNSSRPYSKETEELAGELASKYNVTVIPVNCEQLKKEDISEMLEKILMEFPISEIGFITPQWMEMLKDTHWLKQDVIEKMYSVLEKISCIKDVKQSVLDISDDYIESIKVSHIDMSDGSVKIDVVMRPNIYYDILSELTGTEISNEYELISIIKNLSEKKVEFNKVSSCLADVEQSGFGVVIPQREEITLKEPEIIKNGSKYGVKIKADVPSINMIKTNINVEIAPIVGSKNQAEDLIEYIQENSGDNSMGIWDTNIFGKTIWQIVDDGIYEKTHNMTEESMEKISSTLGKVMNENSGLICLIV